MFSISISYPKAPDSRFDLNYYLNKHMPLSIEKLSAGKGYRGVSVNQGIDIESPPLPSQYHATCHYYFETVEDFMNTFEPHAAELQRDIINYTNVEPVIQISKVQLHNKLFSKS